MVSPYESPQSSLEKSGSGPELDRPSRPYYTHITVNGCNLLGLANIFVSIGFLPPDHDFATESCPWDNLIRTCNLWLLRFRLRFAAPNWWRWSYDATLIATLRGLSLFRPRVDGLSNNGPNRSCNYSK